MQDYFKTDLNRINEAIEKGFVFHSVVKKLGFDENDVAYMSVQIVEENGLHGGYVGRIYIDESDAEMDRRSLMPLLNKNIPFVIIGVDVENGHVICSRKKAQQAIKEKMMPDLQSGKSFRAKIIKIVDFGAFVEVNGISGVLRTTDFSSDHSEIPEYYKVGDSIDVVCRDIDENGRISFKAREVHSRSQPLKYDIQPDQIVMGEVRSLRNFDKGAVAFVRISVGLDCLCPMPEDMEIEKHSSVAVKVHEVRTSEDPLKPPMVRGRILRVY